MSSTLTGLGIMSGSSLDGIDLALVKFEAGAFELIETQSLAIPEDLKLALAKSVDLGLKEYLLLENRYSEFLAQGVKDLMSSPIDFIAVHGHTTIHIPEAGITNQMMNGAILSALTRMVVVTDFRMGDIALGGVGTPLVPQLEKDLFGGYDYYLNLGGIANLTNAKDWTAFDVSPCNQLSNFVARSIGLDYDLDGQLASRGNLNDSLYKSLGQFDYYKRQAPKSIDNNWIKEYYFPLLSNAQIADEDKLNTINHWIVDKLKSEIDPDKTVLCTGGGTYNKHLVELMKGKEIAVVIPDKEIVDFKEAILMAYLGHLRLNNKPNVLSTVTGASMDSIGGAIYNVHGR